MNDMIDFQVTGANNMEALAGQVAKYARQLAVIYLIGELGAGKTTWARGFLKALGHLGAVKSPTYTFIEPYVLQGRHIYHFDLYRLATHDALESLGFREYFANENLCLIEWPERAWQLLPHPDLTIKITGMQDERNVNISADSDLGATVLAELV